MAILIDPARWPAHGTTWAHVVSDSSLDELFTFARRTGLPPRSFDLDHFDVPAQRHAELVAAGAQPVSSAELVTRLRASGLRVRAVDRPAERARRRWADLRGRWAALVGGAETCSGDDRLPAASGTDAAATGGWQAVGEDLLRRWDEPHRHYHDTTHLLAVLECLDVLGDAGEPVDRAVLLAAWFHDAVHAGRAGTDERASADLVAELGPRAGFGRHEIAEVQRLVLLTIDHAPAPSDRAGAALCDADLAILAAPTARYRSYAAAVRREYGHLSGAEFARGRAQVLTSLLERDHLFSTRHGRASWETAARTNLRAERQELLASGEA